MEHELLNDPELSQPIELVQEQPGYRDDFGEWTPGATVTTPTRGPVQPMELSDERLQRLVKEGGDRLIEAVEAFLPRSVDAQPLRVGVGQTGGDILRTDGKDYLVASCLPYPQHSEVIAVLFQEGE
jgi:hypothetical protein